MALGFGGWAKVVREAPGQTHVDAAMRICIAKLDGATIHKRWTNTSGIITSAAINKSKSFGSNLTKLAKEKQTLEMCRNKKILNIAVTYQYRFQQISTTHGI